MVENILDKKKIQDEINDLKSIRAMYHRDLKEYEKKMELKYLDMSVIVQRENRILQRNYLSVVCAV